MTQVLCTLACFAIQVLRCASIRVNDDGFHHDRRVNLF